MFRARKPGNHRIVFAADSSRNRPVTDIAVTVEPRPLGRTLTVIFWVIAFLPFGAFGAWMLRGRVKRRNEPS